VYPVIFIALHLPIAFAMVLRYAYAGTEPNHNQYVFFTVSQVLWYMQGIVNATSYFYLRPRSHPKKRGRKTTTRKRSLTEPKETKKSGEAAAMGLLPSEGGSNGEVAAELEGIRLEPEGIRAAEP
jgi:hypothetical protein